MEPWGKKKKRNGAMVLTSMMILPFAVRSLRQADQVLSGLQKADLPGMVENINNLTKGSQEEINKTVDKLNQLDVESLNKAIQNLENATTIAAMAETDEMIRTGNGQHFEGSTEELFAQILGE